MIYMNDKSDLNPYLHHRRSLRLIGFKSILMEGEFMKRTCFLSFVISIVAITILSWGAAFGEENKAMTHGQQIQRLLDYMEIQNVMAKHSYYYAAQEQWKELDEAWSKKRDDISYGHNDGYYVGRKSVMAYYGQKNETRRKQTLEAVSKVYPDIKNVKENEGIGDLVMHTLTTPYIEIAEDGQTAKGIWMSIGLCSRTGSDGKASAMWLWEKFATDFVKEDGEWKIWHFQIYSDVLGNVDAAMLSMFAQQSQGAATPSGGQKPQEAASPAGGQSQAGPASGGGRPQGGQMSGGFDKNIKIYEIYGATRVPKLVPALPSPYKIWDDSLSLIK